MGFSSSLQDQIITDIARQMQKDIDYNILSSLGISLDFQLIYDTNTVYGKRYYSVKPEWVPDRTYGYNQDWQDMLAWCIEVFGPSKSSIWGENPIPEPMERWYVNNAKFWFRDQKDRDWFTLRWAS
jgi:hypothetical protein